MAKLKYPINYKSIEDISKPVTNPVRENIDNIIAQKKINARMAFENQRLAETTFISTGPRNPEDFSR